VLQSKSKRHKAQEKFRAKMESRILRRDPSRASLVKRYDLLGERYDLEARASTPRMAPLICRLKTQLLNSLISLSSD